MKGKEKPSLKTGAHFVSGSLKITRKTDEEQERAAQADRSASNLKHITAIQELVEVQNKRMFNSY